MKQIYRIQHRSGSKIARGLSILRERKNKKLGLKPLKFLRLLHLTAAQRKKKLDLQGQRINSLVQKLKTNEFDSL